VRSRGGLGLQCPDLPWFRQDTVGSVGLSRASGQGLEGLEVLLLQSRDQANSRWQWDGEDLIPGEERTSLKYSG
jgi:hypothetical protein